jgi:hypothetical protein
MSCKNSIKWQGAEKSVMVRVLSLDPTTQPQIVGWAVSEMRHEIFVEVGLVLVAGLLRDQRPINWLGRVNCAEDMLQPVETGQLFRRDANHPFELREQVVLAKADTVTQRPNPTAHRAAGRSPQHHTARP